MTPRRYARLRAILDRRQLGLTVLMDNVHKPHNLSAIMRTSDAVGIPTIHAVSDGLRFRPSPSSSGGTRRYVEVRTHPDYPTALAHLREQGHRIYAADLDDRAVDFRSLDYTRPTAIVLGAEKQGVREQLRTDCDGTITIPILGAVESLNVSVAAAVILYEAQRQREEAGMYEQIQLDEETRQRLLFEWGYRRLAETYRRRGIPYPRVGPEGELLDPVPGRVGGPGPGKLSGDTPPKP